MKRRDFVRSSVLAAMAAAPGVRVLYAAVSPSGQAPDVLAVTGDGREITLKGADITALAGQLRGPVLLARDPGYDDARRILNPSFDKHPALVVQPVGAADVQSAVKFAREHSLLLAVKCGGHSHSGHSTCDRGMQLDLSMLRGVRVDAKAKRAWVEGGTLLGQVDHETAAHGLVTPLGTVSHTGVGGLTLGGGFGRLARRFGLAIDNLASVDIVTADGQLRHASAQENSDLFWAVRGGGGNFGVVTTFEFRLHPMQPQVIGGMLIFPYEKGRDVLAAWSDYGASAPDELYFDPVLARPPGGAPAVSALQVCYSGPQSQAERAIAPLRKIGTPLKDTIKAVDYVVLQRMQDSSDNRAVASYLKGGFISKLPQDLITGLADGLEGHPGRSTMAFFQHCGGAPSRIPDDATAFAHRYALANMITLAGWQHGADPKEHIEAVRRHYAKLAPFTHGFYVNDMPLEATAREVNANYRGNYPRLVTIKTKYDPTNLFRLNANIQPKAAATQPAA